MAILALGLMKEDHDKIVPYLMDLMGDRGLDRVVRAQAPVALGRLHTYSLDSDGKGGSPEAKASLTRLMGIFENDKTDNDLKRSVALALGMLAEITDTEVIDALLFAIEKATDDQTRHFSIMALARIGGRDRNFAANAEAHNKLKAFFLKELTKPKRITHQPYGAMGLAVYAKGLQDQGTTKEAGDKLLEQFNRTSNPSYRGSMAVALGLLEHKVAQDALWDKFLDSRDQPLKGYIAIGLGLMRANSKAPELRTLILQKGLQPKFRLQLARSLGLMGDADAVKTLIDYLQTASTLAESSSSAQALGLIGDKSAIADLIAICSSQSKSDLQRGFAAVALGILAEKDDIPWNAVFAVDSNYRAKVPALSEILDIL
jgi:HEAT repeat protein